MNKFPITLIASVDINGGIGNGNDLLFDIPYDKKYFKKVTETTREPSKTNVVVMGYNTWASIPRKYKPLRKRLNVVCTRLHTEEFKESSAIACDSFDNVMNVIEESGVDVENIFVIGGGVLYNYFIGTADRVILCNIFKEAPNVTTYFPDFDRSNYNLTDDGGILNVVGINVFTNTTEDLSIRYQTWERKFSGENTEERQYLDLLSQIMMNGKKRETRSGVVRSIFGVQMKYSLTNNTLPLLTTKKMFTRGIIEELLWFVNSKVDSKILESKKVNIWKGNTTREFLDSIGLSHYREGECGPIYGYQWRHFNSEYKGPDADYSGTGVDQLGECIELIKNNPTSRRIIMSGWNPCQLKEMCLPPCHVLYQFYVDSGHLHCSMYQRSGDMFLGIPFNIASTSILTVMIAYITGLKPGSITHTIGDAHIYETHTAQVCTQLFRNPLEFPKIHIKETDKKIEKLEDFDVKNFVISDYFHHSRISAKMSV